MKLGQYTKPRRVGHVAIAKMIAAMSKTPATVEDIVQASGLCDVTVRAYVLTFRKEKAIRVAEWHLDARGRQSRPAYLLGGGPDAKKVLVVLPRAEIARRYRQRKKQLAWQRWTWPAALMPEPQTAASGN